jgi:D-amino-acid oxidase
MAKSVLVLGAGVSGLSSSILLLKAGHPVTIWARDLPPNTTSNKAAAIWWPYLCYPREKAIPWARHSLHFFKEHLVPVAESGCAITTVRDLYERKVGEPWWAEAVDRWQRLDPAKLPKGYVDGYEVETIVIDTSVYMEYLVNWFQKLGGELIQKEVKDISEAFEATNLVINCTGLGSRELFNDQSVHPVRGQVVRVRPNGFKDAIFDDEGRNALAYIIPRSNDVVLGGTSQPNDWDLNIRAEDREAILRKAADLAPEFANVEIVSEGVGLRPARDAVRLETEQIGESTVIHNYGHGGAGFTLSWGCAEEVFELIKANS